MEKKVPLREQIVKACLDSRVNRSSYSNVTEYVMSGCLCYHYMNDNLKKCDKCILRFECYTTFKIVIVS